jgi:TetR/AcrR family transcriptional repressor of nem operon
MFNSLISQHNVDRSCTIAICDIIDIICNDYQEGVVNRLMTDAIPTSRAARRLTKRVTGRAVKKRETHERILKSAGIIAKREGLRAASVPRVMRGAGLTVGGFYSHFPSKTAMDVEIIRSMLGGPSRWLSGLEESAGLEWVQRALKRYLNRGHRDNADGCAYPAVLSEIATSSEEVRDACSEALEARVRAFESQVPPVAGCSARERALATMALTIGGLLLSRATRGSPISEELLGACKKWALPERDVESSSTMRRR